MTNEIDISTRKCNHVVADIALPLNIYLQLKEDLLETYHKNEISFDLVEFKNSKYTTPHINREKIIVNMQIDDDDFDCLKEICKENSINIDNLYNVTFFEFSVLKEYDYTYQVKERSKEAS